MEYFNKSLEELEEIFNRRFKLSGNYYYGFNDNFIIKKKNNHYTIVWDSYWIKELSMDINSLIAFLNFEELKKRRGLTN